MLVGAAAYTLLMVGLVAFSVAKGSTDIFAKEGFNFITQSNWDAVEGRESFGAFPYIIGTLLSAGIAMLIGVPISLGIAIFISEIAPPRIRHSTILSIRTSCCSSKYNLWSLGIIRI